jgi:hypothetical protein
VILPLAHSCCLPACLFLFAALLAQADPTTRSWNQPVEPFKVIGNIHYVEANEITSFLVTTLQGHILLDGGFVETAPQILPNIRKLGFGPQEVKVLPDTRSRSSPPRAASRSGGWRRCPATSSSPRTEASSTWRRNAVGAGRLRRCGRAREHVRRQKAAFEAELARQR